jgi:hypothetical protein
MSEVKFVASPLSAVPTPLELDDLIDRIVQKTLAQVGYANQSNPFVNSKACADLIGVSPEHLCAMRARGQGPPWSGEGKWIRYEREAVLEWIRKLPRQAAPVSPDIALTSLSQMEGVDAG